MPIIILMDFIFFVKIFFISGMVCWYILNSRNVTEFISGRVKRLLKINCPAIYDLKIYCRANLYRF